ncbi:MAG TPA: alpha/beta fold hydrolase [Burkholderiales bacterium]|jgi:hypothetical protein
MQFALNRRTAAAGLLGVAVAAVAGGCAALDIKQREWIFNPSKEDFRGYAGMPAGTQEFWLDVANGQTVPVRTEIPAQDGHPQWIHAWWMPAANPNAPALLYLHGARWNLTGSTWRTQKWREAGFSVLAIDYRGFGESEGDVPSEKGAYEDATAAWAWLKAKQPNARKRIIYGHSLGGAVAIELATHVKPDEAAGLITESTFTSIADMTKTFKWGFLPVGFLITQRFDSEDKIAKVALPKIFVHGTADRFVPPRMSDELYAAAQGQKLLIKVEGAGHSNVVWTDFDPVKNAALALVTGGMHAVPPALNHPRADVEAQTTAPPAGAQPALVR